jgi:hypothetical protein
LLLVSEPATGASSPTDRSKKKNPTQRQPNKIHSSAKKSRKGRVDADS